MDSMKSSVEINVCICNVRGAAFGRGSQCSLEQSSRVEQTQKHTAASRSGGQECRGGVLLIMNAILVIEVKTLQNHIQTKTTLNLFLLGISRGEAVSPRARAAWWLFLP